MKIINQLLCSSFKKTLNTYCVRKSWLSFLCLSACSMAPTLEMPTLPVEDSYPYNMSKDSYDNVDVKTAAQLTYDVIFADPYLNKLIDLGLANNRDLRTAIARIEQARIQYDIQAIQQLPILTGNAAYSAARTSRELTSPISPLETHIYQMNVGITAFEIDFFGRLESLKDVAREQYLATREAAFITQIALIGDIANAYYDERALFAQQAVAEDALRARRDVLQLSQYRFNQGIIPKSDYNINKSLVHAAEISVADLTRQYGQAINKLSYLIGCALPQKKPHEHISDIMATLAPGLPSTLLQTRPDIRQAEHMLRAANANIGAARAAFFPTIALTTAVGTASMDLGHLFQASTQTWNFTPFLTIPIFDWGNRAQNLDLVEVRKEISIIEYERVIQNAFREVSDALIAHDALSKQYEAQRHYTDTIAEQLQLIQLRYNNGLVNEIDVFTVKQETFKAQQDLIYIKYARLKNTATLYKVLGGGQL